MRALVVGAGAVGQVYGLHLQRGGARVSVLVKPQHAAAARGGFTLYPVRGRARTPVRWGGFEVLGDLGAVRAQRWDAVFLCVPSPALRDSAWLAELCAATGDATIVTLQPGPHDHADVCRAAGRARVVAGMVGFLAWAAPLPGETVPAPGTAFWLPPLARCAMSGPRARTAAVAGVLARAGLPAVVRRDVPAALAQAAAILEPHMLALELAGWSLARLRGNGALLATARAASREAARTAAAAHNRRTPLLAGRLPVGLALALAARLAPLDLEAFFRVHYSKVAAQTRQLTAQTRALAAAHGIATPALEALS